MKMNTSAEAVVKRLKEQGVSVVPLTVRFGEEEYIDGETMLPEEFFRRMAEYLPQGLPKTSCPAPGKFEQAFRAAAEGCEGVICITLSSGVSDTHHSACMAADICAQDGIKVEVIDSLAVQEGNSLMCEKAIRMRDAGATLEEAAAHMRRMAQEIQTIVALNQLDNLVKGGRIGKVTGRAANMLGIKPMILFKEGEIFSAGVARGRQKSFEKALDLLMTYLAEHNGTPDDYCITVGYGYDADEGKRLWMQTRAALRAKYPTCECNVVLLQIGCTIAVHTGPYELGMGVMRRWKKA